MMFRANFVLISTVWVHVSQQADYCLGSYDLALIANPRCPDANLFVLTIAYWGNSIIFSTQCPCREYILILHTSFETVHAVFLVIQMFTRKNQRLNFKFRFNANILLYNILLRFWPEAENTLS